MATAIRTISTLDQGENCMMIKVSELKKLVKEKKKRMGKDYIEYLNRKLTNIVLSHINMLGSRGTLKAKDFVYFDAIRKERR